MNCSIFILQLIFVRDYGDITRIEVPYLLPLLHFVCHNSSRPFSLTNEFDFVRVVCWCCSCFCYRTWCCCTSNYRCIHFAILATSKDIILSCSDSFHLKYFTIDAKLAEGSFTHKMTWRTSEEKNQLAFSLALMSKSCSFYQTTKKQTYHDEIPHFCCLSYCRTNGATAG